MSHLGVSSLAILLSGCKANPPSRAEIKLVTAAKHDVLVRAKSQRNPLADGASMIKDGKEAFSQFADRMSPSVPLLSSKEVQIYTDRQLDLVINYGISPSGMPGSKNILTDDEIWPIVVYLRHLPPAGTVGEPEM